VPKDPRQCPVGSIVAELDESAIARHLLEVLDFGPPPGGK
jgi:hypothetical protein